MSDDTARQPARASQSAVGSRQSADSDPQSAIPDARLILVVDDDPDFRAMTQEILEAAGHRVACADDPAVALERMAEAKPDLVVTDLMMKALDSGFSFAQKIKEDPRFRDVPVIVVTAVAARLGLDFTPNGPDDLAAMNADAFFEKPVHPRELLAKVEKLLGGPVEEATR
jgi:putative two-component system response regulator